MGENKPDNIVHDGERYNASLLPYGTNVGAPQIMPENMVAWKSRGINKVNKECQARYNDIKSQYEQLLQEYIDNEVIYSSNFNFEPITGEIYHLYKGKNNQLFLSMISPNEWNKEYMGSYYMDTNKKWIKKNI